MEKKEMTMETRLLLAFLLMGLVLFGTQYLYKPPPAPPKDAAKTTQEAKAKTTPEPTPTPAPAVEMPGQIHADSQETFTVDTDYYHVVFSNRGAVATSWVLKDYKDYEGKALDLVNPRSHDRVPE